MIQRLYKEKINNRLPFYLHPRCFVPLSSHHSIFWVEIKSFFKTKLLYVFYSDCPQISHIIGRGYVMC